MTTELYAYAVSAIRLYESGGEEQATLEMASGLTLADGDEAAEEYARSQCAHLAGDGYYNQMVAVLPMPPAILEALKRAYGLRDNLDIWREQL